MTNDEAIKTLREDYCGNRIICELYPDQCNREDCEIWLAITALAEQPIRVLETQPEIMQDGTLKVTVDADIASIGRILLSQAGTQYGGLYYKDAEPEETCDTCKHGYFGDGKCDYCRERFPSHYERRTDG